MQLPERVHRYQTPASDSQRWDLWRPRDGDILVCTPPKTGTTWTQMLCALLVHQSREFPEPLTRLSRWIDRLSEPIEDVLAQFERQDFRRIFKTHTPLDGLPYYENVSYVFCGRDPRDAHLSMMDHLQNLSEQTIAEVNRRGGLPEGFSLPSDPNVMFQMWMTVPSHPWVPDGFPMGSVIHYAETFWPYRKLPNIYFLHYEDMSTDLAVEMRRLSAFLGIAIDEDVFPSLVAAGDFAAMRDNGEALAPGAHLGEWRDPQVFFKQARRGQWREVLTEENQALYERIAGARLEPQLKLWLEGGRAAAGDPRDN